MIPVDYSIKHKNTPLKLITNRNKMQKKEDDYDLIIENQKKNMQHRQIFFQNSWWRFLFNSNITIKI